MRSDDYFSDEEVNEMCVGLVQTAAKIRFLKKIGLQVFPRRMAGPLVWRPGRGPKPEPAAHNAHPGGGLDTTAMQQWAAGRRKVRKVPDGQKTQGR